MFFNHSHLVMWLLIPLACGCSEPRIPQQTRPSADPIFRPENIADILYVKKRLSEGLDPNLKNNARENQDYLLTYAVRLGAADAVQVLFTAGADVDIRSAGLNKTRCFKPPIPTSSELQRC
jgi:hypothetical protein